MGAFLSGIQIIGGPLPLVIDGIALLALVLLAIRRHPASGARIRWAITVAAALVSGAALGLIACWLAGDVLDLFGVLLSPTTRAWVAAGFAAIALAVLNLFGMRVRRKLAAVGAILSFVLASALGVNADFGQYTTLASVAGLSSIDPIPQSVLDAQRNAKATGDPANTKLWSTWRPPADLPARGIVGWVTIPSTVSHFPARRALAYLPPAALVPNPPALPVFIMLSGQPGSPENVLLAGHFEKLFDAIAAANNGLTPILVVPDQLGSPNVNPMCVDSALGRSASYLTVDVPAWIRANLAVQSRPAAWAIGGWSQGGTCAIQLGAAHPELFGSIFDVSGELAPKNGSVSETIARGFAGDAKAFEAAKPLSILARNAPYTDMVGIFAVGSLDARTAPAVEQVSAAAAAAGIQTTLIRSPGTSHDWFTVQYAVKEGLPVILRQMGIQRPAP